MTEMTLGELIRRHRLKAELKQAELAELIGYSHSHISYIERGQRSLTDEALELFIEKLRLSEEDARELREAHKKYGASSGEVQSGDQLPSGQFQILRREYLDRIKNQFNRANLHGIELSAQWGHSGVVDAPLTEIYVQLQVEVTESGLQTPRHSNILTEFETEETSKPVLPDPEYYGDPVELQELREGNSESRGQITNRQLMGLPEILSEKRFVIQGDLGTGKSTMIQYIALALAIENYENLGQTVQGKIPIYIELAGYAEELKNQTDLSLEDYICRYCWPKYRQVLEAELQLQKCVVLMDGLDEIISDNQRMTVIGEIVTSSNNYKNNHYVITSRPISSKPSNILTRFTKGTVQDLNNKEITKLVHAWYGKLNAMELPSRRFDAQHFLDSIFSDQNINSLVSNPLHLTLLLLMDYQGIRLSNNRVKIYEYFTDTLIYNWHQGKHDLAEFKPNSFITANQISDEVFRVLKPVAFELMLTADSLQISENQLLKILEEASKTRLGYTQEEAPRHAEFLLNIIGAHIRILSKYESDSDRAYRFFHRIYVEYLAALELYDRWNKAKAQDSDVNILVRYLYDKQWEGVLYLLMAHVSNVNSVQASQMLQELTIEDGYEDTLNRNLLFAGKCLSHNVWEETGFGQEIVSKIANLLRSRVAELRDQALNVLKGLRGTKYEYSASRELEEIKNHETSLEIKKAAIDVLIAWGRYGKVRPTLLDWIKYPCGPYSTWALEMLLANESPSQRKVELLKSLISRERENFKFWLWAQTKLEDTAGTYITTTPINLLSYIDKDDLRQLAIAVKEDDTRPKPKREEAELILWQLSPEQPLEEAKRLAFDTENWFVRCQAAQELDKSEKIEVLKTVADKGGEEAIHAARLLYELGERTTAIDILRKTAWTSGYHYVISAIEQLAEYQVTESVIPMVLEDYFENMGSEGHQYQYRAVRAFARVHSGELTTQLWLDIAQQNNHQYRYEAAEELLRANETKAGITALRQIIRRSDLINWIRAVDKLHDISEDIEYLYKNVQQIARQSITPTLKFWVTQKLSELEPDYINKKSPFQPLVRTDNYAEVPLEERHDRQILFSSALSLLDELIDADKNCVDARIAKAGIHRLQKEPQAARDELVKAIHSTPHSWLQIYAVKELKEFGEEAQAIKELERLSNTTNNVDVCIHSARILAEWGETEQAKSALERSKSLQPEKITNWLNIAEIFYKCHDPAKAVEVLRMTKPRLTDDKLSDRDKLPLWLWLADKLNAWGGKEEAGEVQLILDNLTTIEPKSINEIAQIVRIQQDSGLKKELRETLQKAKSLGSKNPFYLIKLAELLHKSDDTAEAAVFLEMSTELAPEWVDVWLYKAHTFNFVGNHEKAIASFQKAISLAPDDHNTYIHLGDTYTTVAGQQKNFEQRKECYLNANSAYEKAIDIVPHHVISWLRCGAVRHRLKDYHGAEWAYLQVLEQDPQSVTGLIGLGRAYYWQEKYDQAIEAFLRAKRQDSRAMAALIGLGNAYHWQGNQEEAIKAFELARGLDNKHVDAYLGLGDAYARQEEYSESIRNYKDALHYSDQKDHTAHGNLADVYLKLKKLDKAEDHYTKKIKLHRAGSFEAYVNLGIIYYHLGEVEKAKSHLEDALKEWDQAWYEGLTLATNLLERKALALVVLGDKDAAFDTLKKALENTSMDEIAKYDLICYDRYDLLEQAPQPIPGLDTMRSLIENAKDNLE